MLLMSPTEASLAIGAKCGGSSPSNEDQALLKVLRWLTPRVEGALNVDSLTRKTCQDVFKVSTCMSGQTLELLLSNGFLVEDTVTVQLPTGDPITGDDAQALVKDMRYGVVELERWSRGAVIVTYESGFEPAPAPSDPPPTYDPEDAVLQNVPDWIKGIVATLLVIWYRTIQTSPKASKELSYGQLAQAINRELYARIYEKYMRPRVGVVFSDRLTYGD